MVAVDNAHENVADDGEELAFGIPDFDSEEDDGEIACKERERVRLANHVRSFDYEREVMLAINVHNDSTHRLKATENEWLPFLRHIDIAPAQQVKRFEYTAVTLEEFNARYVHVPCLIDGIPEAEKWPAVHKWKTEVEFLSWYGDVPVHITEFSDVMGLGKTRRIEIPAKDYQQYCRDNDADFPFYPFERNFDCDGREKLLDDWWSPKYWCDDFYSLNESTRRFFPLTCHRFVLLGGKRTGANLHKDPKGTCAWNTLLAGAKLWAFFPPNTDVATIGAKERGYNSEGPALWWLNTYPRILGQQGMQLALQLPGQTIYVPPNWYHAVLNLEDFTLACTSNTLSLQMMKPQWKDYQKQYADFAAELRGLLSAEQLAFLDGSNDTCC